MENNTNKERLSDGKNSEPKTNNPKTNNPKTNMDRIDTGSSKSTIPERATSKHTETSYNKPKK